MEILLLNLIIIYSSQIANAVVAYLNANDYEAFTQVRSFLQAV